MRVLLILILVLSCSYAHAQVAVVSLSVKYPTITDTTQKKVEYLYLAQEKLRLLHNQKSKDYRDKKITKEEWLEWKETYFASRQEAIIEGILEARIIFKQSTTYTVDLENDFTTKSLISN